jgi:hypothetical protein
VPHASSHFHNDQHDHDDVNYDNDPDYDYDNRADADYDYDYDNDNAIDHDHDARELRSVLPDGLHPPPPPDLDCGDIPYRNFTVIYTVPDPDPHRFDGDHDGIGCET